MIAASFERAAKLRIICAVALLALAAACAGGTVEFKRYADVFVVQRAAGEEALARFASAEAKVSRRATELRERAEAREARRAAGEGAPEPDPTFLPERAAYYVALDRTPAADSLRAGLAGLDAYNGALLALASGETDRAILARLGATTEALSGAATTFGGPAAAVAALVNPAAKTALGALEPVTRLAAGPAFRRQFLDAQPKMAALLKALRDATPIMFEVMLEARKDLTADEPLSAAARGALLEDRRALAGWVETIDRTLEAMALARKAAEEPTAAATLDALDRAALEMRVLGEMLKRAP